MVSRVPFDRHVMVGSNPIQEFHPNYCTTRHMSLGAFQTLGANVWRWTNPYGQTRIVRFERSCERMCGTVTIEVDRYLQSCL